MELYILDCKQCKHRRYIVLIFKSFFSFFTFFFNIFDMYKINVLKKLYTLSSHTKNLIYLIPQLLKKTTKKIHKQ